MKRIWDTLSRWNVSPIAWGVLMTSWVLLYALYLGVDITCAADKGCSSRFARFSNLEFNEVGDTVAGFGSLLAFVWLIVTVMLQSQELKAQRAELRQQRAEWEKISAAQDEQVDILKKQGEIFADEQLSRRHQAAKYKFDELLNEFIHKVSSLYDLDIRGAEYRPERSLETNAHSVLSALVEIAEGDTALSAPEELRPCGPWLAADAEQLEACINDLSEDQKVRARRLGVDRLRERIEKLRQIVEEELSIVDD